MSAYLLFTAGTLGEIRAAWVASNAGASPSSGPIVLRPFMISARARLGSGAATSGDVQEDWTLDDLQSQEPEGQCLAFVEPPWVGLAHMLASPIDGAASPSAWLDEWCEHAAKLLRRAQDNPSGSTLVDATEARQNPSEWIELCRTRFGTIPGDDARALPDADLDPLCAVLAKSLADASDRVRSTYAELLACCVPLHPESAWRSEERLARDAGEAAASRLRALQAPVPAPAPIAIVPEEAGNDVENELLLMQVQQLQEELGAALASGALAMTRLADTQAALALLEESMPRIKLDFEQAEITNASLIAANSDLEKTRNENQLVHIQLAQLQEELAYYYSRAQAMERQAATAVAGNSLIDIAIGGVQLASERTAPPYRELTARLQDVKAGDIAVGAATVRLVEHHGHPGLVVFANQQGPQLFKAWRAQGTEDGIGYALLVPSDASSRSLFDSMDTADWLLLQGVAARIEREAQPSISAVSPIWQQLARRFQQQLQELPPKVRWAAVRFDKIDESTLSCRLELLSCGARQFSSLTANWKLSGASKGITLVCPPNAAPPLLSWPEDAHGNPPQLLMVPTADTTDAACLNQWARLTQPDREFVRQLMSDWSRVAATVPERVLGPNIDAVTVRSAALALEQSVRVKWLGNPAHPGRGKVALMRRIVRRVVRGRSPTAT